VISILEVHFPQSCQFAFLRLFARTKNVLDIRPFLTFFGMLKKIEDSEKIWAKLAHKFATFYEILTLNLINLNKFWNKITFIRTANVQIWPFMILASLIYLSFPFTRNSSFCNHFHRSFFNFFLYASIVQPIRHSPHGHLNEANGFVSKYLKISLFGILD
jgi:hypothetical protein